MKLFTRTSGRRSSEELALIRLEEAVTKYNALASKFNALLAKLDADAGVTDVDYASAIGSASTATKPSDSIREPKLPSKE